MYASLKLSKLLIRVSVEIAQSRVVKLAAAAILPAILAASLCQAQQRTFVSGLGNDLNPCTRAQPCRNFAQAISITNTGGEVVVLDSAGYGPVTIANSVSLIAPPGVYAGISVFSGDGIDVVGSATIILRGLTINNQGSTGSGIAFTGGGTLHIEDCVVSGFSNSSAAGIAFQPLSSSKLEVKDSIIKQNQTGIKVGSGLALIEQTRLEDNAAAGVAAQGGSTVTARNSLVGGGGIGFAAVTSSSNPAELDIESCVASNNGVGVVAQSTSTGVATVRLSDSTITDNTTGLLNNGSPAVLLSRGNNTVEGNGTNTVGTIGSYTAK